MALNAGPLTAWLDGIDLRYIRLGDREVVRQIYVAVRDVTWDSVPPTVSEVSINTGRSSFEVTFKADHLGAEVDFSWLGRITGETDGSVTYEMDGIANTNFTRNRIGICLLHPERECAGLRCTVEHVDGSVEQTRFPLEISPHQAFRDLRAITHRVTDRVSATVRLDGEVFETEDQRNWTDDSFKTYGTPMDLPRPVDVEVGTPTRQTARIELAQAPTGGPVTGVAPPTSPVRLFPMPGAKTTSAPSIGTGAPTAPGITALGDPSLRRLAPSHVRVDVFPAKPGWEADLVAAAALSQDISAGLELALYLSDDFEKDISAIGETVGAVAVKSVTAFAAGAHETPDGYAVEVMPALRDAFEGVLCGLGSAADFCQLNRGRPSASGSDFVTFSINPQVHAFDDSSIMDTPSAQGTTVRSAKSLYPQAAVHVGPISLLPRFNANVPPSTMGFRPAPSDPRQAGLFTAAWAAASYKYLAEAGATSLTYFEAMGPAGLKPSRGSGVYPAYHLMREVATLASNSITPMSSASPKTANAFRVTADDGVHTVAFSQTDDTTAVRVEGIGANITVRALGPDTVDAACADPERFWRSGEPGIISDNALETELAPYSLLFIHQSQS